MNVGVDVASAAGVKTPDNAKHLRRVLQGQAMRRHQDLPLLITARPRISTTIPALDGLLDLPVPIPRRSRSTLLPEAEVPVCPSPGVVPDARPPLVGEIPSVPQVEVVQTEVPAIAILEESDHDASHELAAVMQTRDVHPEDEFRWGRVMNPSRKLF